MKKLFCTLFLSLALLFAQQLNAQQSYTSHKIKAGESLSGLAKKYHTSVGDIMRLNKMNAQSQLKIGETIRIPTTKQATATTANTNSVKTQQTTTSKPPVTVNPKADPQAVTHVVKQGETLYQISKQYDVSVLSIMNLNDLATADLKAGQVLIIKETLPVNPTSNKAVKEENELRVKKATQITASSAKESPITKEPDAVVNNTNTVTVSDNISTKSPKTKASTSQNVPTNISSTGYFASQFGVDVEGRDLETKNGSSMIFKTASGWADKKYYILMDDVPPGSIVKISSDNNKVIYAKVLWSLGKMKENDGLTFRISDAAASALGINDLKFNLTVTYYE